jgi:hypothetical protein
MKVPPGGSDGFVSGKNPGVRLRTMELFIRKNDPWLKELKDKNAPKEDSCELE